MDDSNPFDLVVVGGGINGAGIAADAAGRGLSVLLVEQGDLGGATSSASSKLIHGGLRYLEHYAFRLVREALGEREVLLSVAPHIVRPMRFVLPHVPGMRSRTLLRLGLFLYDHLGHRQTIPASAAIDLDTDPAGRPLRAGLHSGFGYWDCWVDDARLVILNAQQAAGRGARIATRTRVTGLYCDAGAWLITLVSQSGARTVRARAVVNAAGPWVGDVLRLAAANGAIFPPFPALRLVRGSHVVVPRYPGADDAYLLQRADGRIVFALPFEGAFTLLGTTDIPITGPADDPRPSPEEEAYLVEAANEFFSRRISRRDVVWSFAGVRPLFDDASETAAAVSRDWKLDVRTSSAGQPLLTVIGGKITTYRRLSEAALDALRPTFPGLAPPWTASAPLPGGDLESLGFSSIDAFTADLVQRRPGFDPVFLRTLATRYGTRAHNVLGPAANPADLGPSVAGLSRREIRYLAEHEWARTADDVLWRRTKVGVHIPLRARAETRAIIQQWLDDALIAAI